MTKSLIDIHIHALPFPDKEGGDVFRPTPLRGLAANHLRNALAAGGAAALREKYLEKLSSEIGRSRYVKAGVLLALDGVYTPSGEPDMEKTRFMVSNDSVFDAAGKYPGLLAGASVNPLRRDAMDELSRCGEYGAALMKVIPSAQGFDPSDRRFIPFWKKLAELKLPLITHPGSEFALPVVDRSLGEPSFLRPALDCGVRVIFAHGLSSGVFFHERYFNTAKELIKTYPNLFLDASALTLPTRMRMLLKIRDNPEIKERLLFGSDYPLPAFSSLLRPFMRRSGYPEVKAEGNYFDRLVLIFRALGIDFSISLQDKLIDKPVG